MSNGIRIHNDLVRKQTFIQPFSQTSQMIELYCEYLSVRCISLGNDKIQSNAPCS